MIHEVTGDILFTKSQALAHGVAPNDHFGSGLALALRESWPAMVKDFRHWASQTQPKPGGLWTWSGAGGVRIINLLTQDGLHLQGAKPGKANVGNVSQCLRALRAEIEKEKLRSVALPRLATGVGGLQWKEVEPLVRKHLGDLKASIYVYTTYTKGLKAVEPI